MATIHYFGPAREIVGSGSETIELEGEMSLEAFWQMFINRHPALSGLHKSSRIAVNMEYADNETVITDHTEIAVIPPVAGG